MVRVTVSGRLWISAGWPGAGARILNFINNHCGSEPISLPAPRGSATLNYPRFGKNKPAGNHYLADRDLGIAETNRDVFLLLNSAGELEASLAKDLAQWAGFQNVLAHEYLKLDHAISWEAIQSRLMAIGSFYEWAASKLPG